MAEPLRLGLIAADTTRTRAYAAMLAREGIALTALLRMETPAEALGRARAPITERPGPDDPIWAEAAFDPGAPLHETLAPVQADATRTIPADINSAECVSAVAEAGCDVMIFSGYGGQILRAPILEAGPRLLHAHAGSLPAFRGSTTIYYEALATQRIAATAIFLAPELDSGPALLHRAWPVPAKRHLMDHLHDPAMRAIVLRDTLRARQETGTWPSLPTLDQSARTYFVIHPFLKHTAVFNRRVERDK
ncbi:MAG: formyltransferase family protein [Shimia sp.]